MVNALIKTMKNCILNTIAVCNNSFAISVVILEGYLTVELFYKVLRHLIDKLKTFRLFFLGITEG